MSITYYDKNSGSITQGLFDVSKDYKNEYANVYFRIETPLYYSSDGTFFRTTSDREYFNVEIMKVFLDTGWTRLDENKNQIYDIERKHENLYIHPQLITGIVLKNNIVEIAEGINGSSCSSIRWVDIYETFWDITDNEFLELLHKKEEAIIKDILIAGKTNRRKRFRSKNDIVCRMAGIYSVKRLGDDRHCGIYYRSEISRKFIEELLNKIVDVGYMKTAGNNELVRTCNKTELKELQLPNDFDVAAKNLVLGKEKSKRE